MLSENAPDCVCGAHSYDGGGGTCSPGFSYTCFKCRECSRSVVVFEGCMGCAPITFFALDGKDWETYCNSTMMRVWRGAEESGDRCPIPPQLPTELDVSVQTSEGNWEWVDHNHSRTLPIPPDPIRIKHDKFWRDVMKEVGLPEVKEIQNKYYGDENNSEPWYECQVNGKTFTFGPRKRVYSIQVTADKPFDVSVISAAAKEANTTYMADGGWQPWAAPEASSVEVHAWGREPLIKYFEMLLEA